MIRPLKLCRWVSSVIGFLALVAAIALGFNASFGKPSTALLWTDRPIIPAPVALRPAPWVELAKQLKPAVVNINTKRTEEGQPELQFFGTFPPHAVHSGSGFVINPNGYVVTNDHVVDNAAEIRIKLSDGREFAATIVGRDPKSDLALLKIDGTRLPVIPLGDSSEVQVGEPVMAIGNPFGLEQTVTTGIVSATGRVIGAGPYDNFIQTDASINPGNSGGPLISTRGQAIGINAAIATASGGSNGIGFASPISPAKIVIGQLGATGHVVRGWLGVTLQPLTPDLAKSLQAPDTNGALIASILMDSPAMSAGLKPGDIITAYDGRPVVRSDALPRVVAETPIGRDVPITVLRAGQRLVLAARILADAQKRVPTGTPERTSLGLAVQSLTPRVVRELGVPDTHGVLVRGVEDASLASNAGIRPGDVIVEIDRQPIESAADFERSVSEHRPGTPILMLVHRNGQSLFAAVG